MNNHRQYKLHIDQKTKIISEHDSKTRMKLSQLQNEKI